MSDVDTVEKLGLHCKQFVIQIRRHVSNKQRGRAGTARQLFRQFIEERLAIGHQDIAASIDQLG